MDNQATSSTSQSQQPQRLRGKKRKTEGVSVTKKARGQPTRLIEMPMDILFEVGSRISIRPDTDHDDVGFFKIFSRVDALDLLSLVQTNKAMREVLLNKSPKFIWKHSYQNTEPPLPSCPDHISEPAFAEFMLGKGCHLCHRKVKDTLPWGCQLRTCMKCLKVHFKNEEVLVAHDVGSLKIIPPCIRTRNKLDQKWREELNQLHSAEKRREWCEQKIKYIANAESTVNFANIGLKKERRSSGRTTNSHSKIEMQPSQRPWMGEELDKLKDDDQKPQNLYDVEIACRKPLTTRVLKELRPTLIEFMEGVKATRLDLERQAFLETRVVILRDLHKDYLGKLPASFEYAKIADIFQSPAIQDIINDASSPELTESHRNRLTAAFPQAQDAWKASVKDQILQIVLEVTAKGNSTPSSPVSLETIYTDSSLFLFCQLCDLHIPASDAVGHFCTRFIPPYQKQMQEKKWISDDKALFTFVRSFRWNATQRLVFHQNVSKKVALVLKKFSYQQVPNYPDEVDPIFECLACHSESSGRFTMRWRSLANHFWNYKDVEHSVGKHFRLVKEPEALVVRSRIAEARAISFAESTHARHAMCMYRQFQQTYSNLLSHTRTEHSIVEPKLGQDILASTYFVADREFHRLWPPLSQEEVVALVA
ncbi:hypothetical protein CPB83DRAFT_897297 [Crepidotus variabilis]|uniref:F-box domain-containing protein n=1 Tax=Crepidotus variabilis TaxID=179855 RepID=A0A9P6EA05_9AGAR|nr:hypothetical protein CPB83DRAFT_897297 [Crepidotus variabilis]